MGLFTKIASIFSGGTESKPAYPSEEYKGFTITPTPLSDNGQFRISAVIEKAVDGDDENKKYDFIRSDTTASADLAAELALSKSKIYIDQMGDQIFK